MTPVVVLAGPVALAAVLLLLRARDGRTGSVRRDAWTGRFLVGMVVLFLVVWPWPTSLIRAWVGYVPASDCAGKRVGPPPMAGESTTIDQVKAEVRARALDPAAPSDVVSDRTIQVHAVTGPASPARTDERWDVMSTDLGHPFWLGDRLGLLFGDTFAGPGPGSSGWRSNVLAWVDDPRPDRLEITAMHTSRPGRAGELLGSLKQGGWEQTVIPTNAIAIDGRVVMHYMSVGCWGRAGRWVVRRAGLAVSSDGGETFRRVGSATWPAGSPFAQVAFVPGDDWIHAFGIPEGRDGGAHLARVRPDRLLFEPDWQYWDGEDWSPDLADAVPLVPPPVGELSVAFSPQHQRWLMLYLDETRGGIVLRTAASLTGPWSRASLVASRTQFPQLYAPYLLPNLSDEEAIRWTMSRYDFYNVVLMESRLRSASG